MIVLNLSCSNAHGFDGWFASFEAFQTQTDQGMVVCPHCNSNVIEKLPAGPHVRRSLPVRQTETPIVKPEDAVKLRAVIEELLRQSENVGANFPEVARKIHYSEIPARSVHGTATADEVISLLEEDISVIPLPGHPRSDIH